MPVTGDRYRWECRMAPGETVAGPDDARSGWRALLAPVDPATVEVVRAVEYTFRAQVADRWRAGRVLLAGDAAHLSPPFVGQGLGLGLRDVHQLAWKLAAVLAGAADDGLLDTYQAEREPHARALIRLALLLGRLMTGGGRGGDAIRRAVLAVVRRIPAVARLATDSRTPPLRRGRWSSAAAGPAGGWRARSCRSRRSWSAGGGAGWTTSSGAGAAEPCWPTTASWCAGTTGRRSPVEDPPGRCGAGCGGPASGVRIRPDRIVRAALTRS